MLLGIAMARGSSSAVIFIVPGLCCAIIAAWMHGFVLMSGAFVALHGWSRGTDVHEHLDALVVGACTLLAGAALFGGNFAQESGVKLLPVALEGYPVMILSAAGILAAHILSCALAVGIASRTGSAPET